MSEKKTLKRSSTNKWVSGVLGGFGEYFNIDPNILRVLFILFSLLPGPSIIFYIVCAIIMPKDDHY
jgi:phage shock protein C